MCESFNSVVDLTESNFQTFLPNVLEVINECDFIAFDLEFSGTDYKPYFRSVYTDTFETRYAKYRVDVENFYPIELGICCFTWNPEKQCYTSRPLNFFVCPYSHRLCNPNLSIRASTMGFLREHNFKFGSLLSDGIPTLRKSDEERILEYMRMSSDRYDYKNEHEKEFMENVYQQIDTWIESLNSQAEQTDSASTVTLSLLLPPMDSHKRKLLYQHAANVYPMLLLKETPEDNLNCNGKTRATRVFITKKENEKLNPAIPDIVNHAGVRAVVEAILESKKPLIGFQAMGDIAYMLGGIYRELPSRLTEFLEMMEEVDVLVDLKTVVMMESLKGDGLMNCSLSKAYEAMVGKDYGEPSVVSALIDNTSITIHDAANDAYMTAMLFLKLWYRCGFNRDSISLLSQWNQEETVTTLEIMKKEFLKCVNQVNLYHMPYNLPLRLDLYNNLVNEHKEELCNRDNVLVIENIPPWLNSKHFTTFFKKQYSVSSSQFFNWLTDSKLLVQLPSKEVVDKICDDWKEVVTSDDSEGSNYRRVLDLDPDVDMPVDFCNRHVVLKDLRVSRFVRYEELCFVNKHHVRNCYCVCLMAYVQCR